MKKVGAGAKDVPRAHPDSPKPFKNVADSAVFPKAPSAELSLESCAAGQLFLRKVSPRVTFCEKNGAGAEDVPRAHPESP